MIGHMPQKQLTINDAETRLLSYSPIKMTGESYKLDRMRELMRRLNNPQNNLKIIHVAGTSGKTSTSYYIRSLLEATGAKVGLTASPHIVSITERIQIGGKPLADDIFLEYLNRFLGIIEAWPEIEPTYFELLVALAYWVFREESVDYAVVEVGLGGMLDATNVISRDDKICVITPIGLDHTNILGDSISAIAAQKAGIIGPHQAVFSAPQLELAANAIRKRVELQTGELHITSDKIQHTDLPSFQQLNFMLARSVVEYVITRDGLEKLTDIQLQKSAYDTPPGRFEKFQIGSKVIILDGAHNPQKLAALIDTLQQKEITGAAWLTGFIEAPEQKIEDCLAIIASSQPAYCTFTQFSVGQDIKGRKSVAAADLQREAARLKLQSDIITNPEQALAHVLNKPATTIIVTGSLYLVSLLRPVLLRHLG